MMRARRLVAGLVLAALTALSLGIVSRPAGASGLTITDFTPRSGPVGTTVKVTGSGFVSGDQVQFGGVQASPVKVNAAGTKITAVVPAFAASGPITVVDPAGLSAQSSGTFDVTPGIAAVPAKQWPGLITTIEGSGLAPQTSVTVTMNGAPLMRADTDANGDFAVRYQVPANEGPQLLTLGIANYALAPFPFLVLSTWPQFQHDTTHTGADPFDLFLTKSHIQSGLKQQMALALGTSYVRGSAIVSGMAYVSRYNYKTDQSFVSAVNLTTKKVWWTSIPLGGGVTAPAVVGGQVYVGSGGALQPNGYVYSFPTGCSNPCSPTWVSTAGPRFDYDNPTVYNGEVYIGGYDGRLYVYPIPCSNPCPPLWISQPTGGFQSSPAVVNGEIYIGSLDGRLYAFPTLCASPCAPSWVSQPTGAAIQSSPTVDNSTVIVGSYQKLYAFPTSCVSPCTPTWVSTPLPGTIGGSLAVNNAEVYLAAGSSLYGFSESCSNPCAPVWQTQSEPSSFASTASPVMVNGMLFDVTWPQTATTGGVLYAFDTSNTGCSPSCAPVWQSTSGQELGSDLAVAGSVFVGSLNGVFYSFG